MQSYYDFGAPADFKVILEQISSDELMFIYEGVTALKTALQQAEEKSLQHFPYENYCQKLVNILKLQAEIEELGNEMKLMAINCIQSLIDIFPQHVGYIVSIGLIQALNESIETGKNYGYLELVEEGIKCCERISLDSPREVLRSKVLTTSFEMLDVFSPHTQTKMLSLLSNVSSSSETVKDFEENLLPVVPHICQMFQDCVRNQERSKVEKLSTILSRIAASPSHLLGSMDNFDKIGSLFDQLSNAGVHETILESIRKHSNYVQASTKQGIQSSDAQVMINTASQSSQTFSEQSVSNMLRVLQYSCQFSQQVVMQLASASIFEILDPLLPLQPEEEHTLIMTDVLSLIICLLPSSELQKEQPEDIVDDFSDGQTLSPSDAEQGPSKFQESKRNYETEKRSFFKSQETQIFQQAAKSLLPKIFIAYSQLISNNFRTKCLTSIQIMLQVIPQQLLLEQFDPASFTKFIHMILRQQQPQQVLCCLQTVLQLLESEYGNQLCLFFIRHGIREAIFEYTKPELIEILNAFEIPKQNSHVLEVDMSREELLEFMHKDRKRLTSQYADMKNLLEKESVKGPKRQQIEQMVVKVEETLKQLDAKMVDLQKALGSGAPKEKALTVQKFGTSIAKLANLIKEKFIDNESYWAPIKQECPDDVSFQLELAQLSIDLLEEAKNENFNFEKSKQLMTQLAQALTKMKGGLTSFEFVKSGLLNSIQTILTMSATKIKLKQGTQQAEESKTIETPKPQLTKDEAIAYILRLKLFVDAMCTKIDDQLPFRSLFNLCHEQLTLAEPLIFKENQADLLAAQQELQQRERTNILVNLVYDASGKNCLPPQEETKQELPFDHLQAQDEVLKKSLVLTRRQELYELLREFPIPLRQQDTVLQLEDFLLKRVKTDSDVHSMLNQRERFTGGQRFAEVDVASEIKPDEEPLFERFMQQITDLVDDCSNKEMFDARSSDVVNDLVDQITEWEETTGLILSNSFYKYLQNNIIEMITQIAQEDQEEAEFQDNLEVLKENLAEQTASLVQLFEQVKKQAQAKNFKWETFQKLDRSTQVAQLPESLYETIELREEELASSHTHTLIKHQPGQRQGYRCDKITGARVCRSQRTSFHQKYVQGWFCQQCDFDLCLPCLQIDKYLSNPDKLQQKDDSQIKSELKVPLDELLKSHEDVEILFYMNKKQLSRTANFSDICKEPIEKGSEQKSKEMLFFGGGHEMRTIYFMIRDRVKQDSKQLETVQIQRKDSLVEYAQIKRKRTKSIFVNEISAQSISQTVESMISEFTVEGLSQKDQPQNENIESLEHTLKVMNVLWHIYTNLNMFKTKGLNILLGGKSQKLIPSAYDNDILLNHLLSEMTLNCFHHAKLDNNLQNSISDPRKHFAGVIQKTLKVIFNSCYFLFSFEAKQLFLRLVGISSVDPRRGMHFMRKHLEKNGKQSQVPPHSRDEEKRQVEKQKICVERNQSMVTQCLKMGDQIMRRAMLEVTYKDEEGTGIGPTLEFYSLLGKEIKTDKLLWRENTVDHMLYPRSIQITSENQIIVQQICEKFKLAGVFVARSILEDRLIDLPISKLMWDLIFGKKMNLFDLMKLDTELYKTFSELQDMANRKQEIDQMEISHDEKQNLYKEIKSSKNETLESFCLSFYNPQDDSIELVKDGHDVLVTLENLQSYIDLVLDSIFNDSITLQIDSFKKGFNSLLKVDFLKNFTGQDELETLICGQTALQCEEWTDLSRLSELIKPDHGYNHNSKPFKNFLRYIVEMQPELRSTFIKFLTGSPRLPIGGFGALEPRLTVVIKKPERNKKETADQILPSVMTCQNYVKMPEYSSYEKLKEKFDKAVQEGSEGFSLS